MQVASCLAQSPSQGGFDPTIHEIKTRAATKRQTLSHACATSQTFRHRHFKNASVPPSFINRIITAHMSVGTPMGWIPEWKS